jgi:uncharacterized protein YndB with AHSA1/START domain
MSTFSESIVISAPLFRVWDTLGDIGRIHEWNPGVVASRKTTPGDDGVGASRHCDLGGRHYLDEEVVEWEPQRALTMRITATSLPLKSADIRFTLVGHGHQTTVTVSPTYTLKFGWAGQLLDRVAVRSQYRRGMANLLRGLKQHIEGRPATELSE